MTALLLHNVKLIILLVLIDLIVGFKAPVNGIAWQPSVPAREAVGRPV